MKLPALAFALAGRLLPPALLMLATACGGHAGDSPELPESFECGADAPLGHVTVFYAADSAPDLVHVQCVEPRTGRATVRTVRLVDGHAEAEAGACGARVVLDGTRLAIGDAAPNSVWDCASGVKP